MKSLGGLDIETALGMPVSEALELWRSEGAPLIHLEPGENCYDLEELLNTTNVRSEHLNVVKDWLEMRIVGSSQSPVKEGK